MEDYQSKKISEWLENLRPKIDRLIEKYLPRKVNNLWLKEVLKRIDFEISKKAIQKAILDPFWDFLDRGGKRWRSALFLLILEALGGNVKKFEDFSIVPEILHNSSLIIDDIEDMGELRRGKPCLHRIYGIDITLNVGNFFYFFPIYIFEKQKRKLKKEIYLKLLESYLEEMEKLHFGQGIDIFWHRGKEREISEKEYFQMCAFKTGCMARLAAKMAAILAEKENRIVEIFGKFAQSIGIAFQIQDDILDITLSKKERKKFGKAFGNDIKEGKRSLMVIYTLKKAKKRDKERLVEILDKHTDNFKEKIEAISIIEKWGGIEYAKMISEKMSKKSWQEIEKILLQSKAKVLLRELVNFLISRKF